MDDIGHAHLDFRVRVRHAHRRGAGKIALRAVAADPLRERLQLHRLAQIKADAQRIALRRHLLRGEPTQDKNNRHFGRRRIIQLVQNRQAVHARQHRIEQQHIRRAVEDLPRQSVAVRKRADDFHAIVPRQRLVKQLAKLRVFVSNQHPNSILHDVIPCLPAYP